MSARVPVPLNLVLTPECFRAFFVDLDLVNVACIKITLAKAAGYGIVVASSLLKLPIFFNIFQARTTQGISLSSTVLEQTVYIASAANSLIKGHPFSTFGECILIAAQNVFLLVLMAWFGQTSAATIALVISSLLGFSFACAFMPLAYVDLLVWFSMAFSIASRMPQILENQRAGHTGVQSAVTISLNLAGVVVRLATVVVETGDGIIVASLILSLALNATLLAQILTFKQATLRALHQKSEKKD